MREFYIAACYCGDISTPQNVTLNKTNCDWLFDMLIKQPHGRALAISPKVWLRLKKDGRHVSASFHYRKVKRMHLSMAAAILSKLHHLEPSLRSSDSFGAQVCAVVIRLEPESAQ